jgi:hypothetical protein
MPVTGLRTPSEANRLGLDYRHEAGHLPWRGPIWDVHSHVRTLETARPFAEAARAYGVTRIWTMTQLEEVDAIRGEYGDFFRFIAVPNYHAARNDPAVFHGDFLRRIEGFAAKGVRMCKFWAAPRGRDLHPLLRLDAPPVQEAMELAASCGMMFMTHVADPDTWFATHYRDARRYGTKAEQYEPLERLLERFRGTPWIAAHLGGHPEDLWHLQELLDRHPNLHLDNSATKWMVRELSRRPEAYRAFCERNPGRVLFGSDNVADPGVASFELLASRYWALRTLHETRYEGPCPIVDPDLSLVDPSLPADSTATLRGAAFDPVTLDSVYHSAADRLLTPWGA